MWFTKKYDTSKLTLELRDIVDNGVDIWDFDYPSYYEGDKKKEFEQKVIDHYYFRQIGQETIGRFKHYFKMKMREIMPRYLDLYRTVEIMSAVEDPFGNVDIVETFEEESTSSGQSSASGSSSSSTAGTNESNKSSNDANTHKMSNTPQGSITNIDKYMTEASTDTRLITDTEGSSSEVNSEGESSSSSESSGSGTVRHTLTKKGNQGVNTYAHDIIEFRQSIIDVDMMIIEDLNELFLGVY